MSRKGHVNWRRAPVAISHDHKDLGATGVSALSVDDGDLDEEYADDDAIDAYHMAKYRYSFTMARLLIEHGADIRKAERDYMRELNDSTQAQVGRSYSRSQIGFLAILERRSSVLNQRRTLPTDSDLEALKAALQKDISAALAGSESESESDESESEILFTESEMTAIFRDVLGS